MSVCKESNDPRPSCSSNSDCLKTAQAKCSSGEKLPHNECILEPFMDYSKNPPFLNDNDVGKC